MDHSTLKFCVLLILVGFLVNVSFAKNDFENCKRIVKVWADSSLDQEIGEDKHKLRDLLFFLHVPRTGGRTYFHCFLKKLYPSYLECPRSYDKLRFDPRVRISAMVRLLLSDQEIMSLNPGNSFSTRGNKTAYMYHLRTREKNCRLLVTHDDYSMIPKLPRQKTSVVTILRDPIDRVFSTYEFSIEVAARFLVHPNLTSATQMTKRLRSKSKGVSTLDIWPWKYLVPWMREDLFARTLNGQRDARYSRGLNTTESNDSYDMEDFAMPLKEYINHPAAGDVVHNGATFQVAGLTNNSYIAEAHEVRHCVQKYKILGKFVLQVAKKRLDDMLYVGLTEEHRESATMFANVVGAQVISQLNAPNSSLDIGDKIEQRSFSDSDPHSSEHQNSTSDRGASKVTSSDSGEATELNMTVGELMNSYEGCTSNLRKSYSGRRIASLKRISPVNFSREARLEVSEEVLQEIRSLNDLDIELYEYARAIFYRQHKTTLQTFTEVIVCPRFSNNCCNCFGIGYIADMKDCWFLDNNFNGLSDGIFDDVVEFFDFPIEDAETDVVEEDWAAQFKHLEEPSVGVFSISSFGLCDTTQNVTPKLGAGSTSSASIRALEVLSNIFVAFWLREKIVERRCSSLGGKLDGDSNARLEKTAGPTYDKTTPNQNVPFNSKDVHKFRTYSPVSVFESSSSSSVENSNFDLPVIPLKRPRGKRLRLSSFNQLLSLPFISPSPDFETQASGKLKTRVKRQRKKDLLLLPDHCEMKRLLSQESDVFGKCTHCEVTETPQWREGPMGPKTLCNACGVRYRSGRLFPEYRPAASPTFVASLHSNSHKKVIEMRSGAIKKTIRGSVFSL
ncbi:hypothetical protein TanjilG_23597 [Lupinus angustifolius]|uniref:GATA-type domain-containing protein n=1 Tax=Lupinus angustifolius TaxID=3871 RepID=A0A4P1R9V7_LUPAN|nr:hypothetical protein TanjilG_23597 [Lupinus angustifolius]